jgi:hypothetical protein
MHPVAELGRKLRQRRLIKVTTVSIATKPGMSPIAAISGGAEFQANQCVINVPSVAAAAARAA